MRVFEIVSNSIRREAVLADGAVNRRLAQIVEKTIALRCYWVDQRGQSQRTVEILRGSTYFKVVVFV